MMTQNCESVTASAAIFEPDGVDEFFGREISYTSPEGLF
jgi:hypothetical protein